MNISNEGIIVILFVGLVAGWLAGKIVRGTIKKMADGAPYTIPPTIEDAAVIDEIKDNLSGLGYPRKI